MSEQWLDEARELVSAVDSGEREVEMSGIQEMEKLLVPGRQRLREMRNLVLELKGNIRVYARVRPFHNHGRESEAGLSPIQIMPDEKTLKIIDKQNTSHIFKFTRVFGQTSSQQVVFDKLSEFVQSALDGYPVCLLSYGQTGSGKTYTMVGSNGDKGKMAGIIPRAMKKILDAAAEMTLR